MTRFFTPLTIVLAAMFAAAPVLIVGAPYESSMGLVQKIFYFHFSAWMGMFAATGVCGVAERPRPLPAAGRTPTCQRLRRRSWWWCSA